MSSLYREIMDHILAMPEDFIHTDAGRLLLAEALPLAPPDIKAKMDAKLRELGMLPEVMFVDDEGNGVFTVGQLAETLGTSVEEVQRMAKECADHHPTVKPSGTIHRLH